MNAVLSLLIIAVGPDVPFDERYPGATEVFHCTFDKSWDQNFDGEPDGWVRHRGPGYPHYLKIAISQQSTPVGDRCLKIDLDGGAAIYYSPPIPVRSLYTYVLEGLLATEGLQHDHARFSLTLLDDKRHRLETFCSESIRDSQGWTRLRLGPIAPSNDDTKFAVIGLHLEPGGSKSDLRGTALFEDVWLGRLPRISLSTNSVHQVFSESEEITVTCKASGLPEQNPTLLFHLEDEAGRQIAEDRRQMTTRLPMGEYFSADGQNDEVSGFIGSANWEPPVSEPGYYRVRVTITASDDLVHRRELPFVVIRPHGELAASEFGWTLPKGDSPLAMLELSELIFQAGIGWVKYPLWYDEAVVGDRMQELNRFSERLAARGIELVALLHDPPEELRTRFQDLKSPAEIFTAKPELWYPSLESVMIRMATQVRWWQLGDDHDTGFVGYPKLVEKIGNVKSQLDLLGHDVNVGFGWGWINQMPQLDQGEPPWRFLCLSADPPLTHRELSEYLQAGKKSQLRRWVVLDPLQRDRYDLTTRATDLVRRMMAAKIDEADAVFIPDPFDGRTGLFNDDGTVGELFLPWRTTALMLGGTQYLGSIRLPNGSPNRIFAHADEAVMVVWNDKPGREVIYLGREVHQVDLWGRDRIPGLEEHRQVIEVGPLPVFLTGINKQITRWRQDFSLETDRIPSIAGSRHRIGFRMKNHYDDGVSGRLEMAADLGKLEPDQFDFRLELPDQEFERGFWITLPFEVASGRHPVRVDMEVNSEVRDRFSIYRHMDVGAGDVYVKLITRLDERGELQVEQQLVNDTEDPVSFQCHLRAPDRRRQKTQIIGLSRGQDVYTYRFLEGAELIGKTLWLRAKEIGGTRILNYRFVATE